MKKKIAFVIESLQLGGAEKSLVTLLQHLDDSKYEVDLIYFHPDGFFKEMVPKTVHHIVLEFPKISFFERLKYAFKKKSVKNYHNAQLFWPLVEPHLKKIEKEYDIAVAYNQGFATYFTQKFISAKTKYAWINTDYRKAGYRIEFDKDFYIGFKKVVCVSPKAENSFLEACKADDFKPDTIVIGDIIDPEFVRRQADSELKIKFDNRRINIVSVGRLSSVKGFDLAIDACRILNSKEYPVSWYIIGEGSMRTELEKQIHDKKLEKNFFLPGADPNPYPYIKNCDIYVQTSLFEGLGLTVIESAMLCKPIVSTNFPTVYGIIENEKTGLISEMNARDIAEKTERIILDKDLKNTLSENLKQKEYRDTEKSLEKINRLFAG